MDSPQRYWRGQAPPGPHFLGPWLSLPLLARHSLAIEHKRYWNRPVAYPIGCSVLSSKGKGLIWG